MMKLNKKMMGLAAGALLLAGCSMNADSAQEVAVRGASEERQEIPAEKTNFISLEEAKQIAFDHAGVDGSRADFDDEELDRDDREYELEFKVDGIEYEYDIHAVTGEILDTERDDKDDREKEQTNQNQQGDFISLEEAKQIAFENAGVDGSKADFDDEELDRDDREYELEFKVDGVEYEYDIHAVTGEVLDRERDGGAVDGNNQNSKQQSQQQETAQKQGSNGTSKEQAIEIALNHAGVSRSNAVIDEVELDDDDGVRMYEIEFDSGNREYEYDIHAENGTVLDYEVEIDD